MKKEIRIYGAFVFGAAVICAAPAVAKSPVGTNTAEFAKVTTVRGAATYEGKAITLGQSIRTEGFLETGNDGFVQLSFGEKRADLTVIPKSRIQIARPGPQSAGYLFERGGCKWTVSPNETKTRWIQVKTKTAVMGVRGTEFFTYTRPELGETEMVVTRGKVEFAPQTTGGQAALAPIEISQGQWIGFGGRYSENVPKVLNLKPETVDALQAEFKN